MDPELPAKVLAELRAIAAQSHTRLENSPGQPGDVILLLQPLRPDNRPEDLVAIIDRLAEKNFLTGTAHLKQHGIAGALVPGALATGLGFHLDLAESEGQSLLDALFTEPPTRTRALVTTRPKAHLPLSNFVDRRGMFTADALGRITAGDLRIRWMGETVLDLESCSELLP